MRSFIAIIALSMIAGISMDVQAQKWTKEEQEFLDHFKNIWDRLEINNEATFDLWREVVNPQENITWWFTHQGMPYDLEGVKKWHQSWATFEANVIYNNIRPIEIKIIDNMAMIWFYSYGEWMGKDGKRNTWEDKRLEIYHNKNGKWFFVGGMVDAIDPFEN